MNKFTLRFQFYDELNHAGLSCSEQPNRIDFILVVRTYTGNVIVTFTETEITFSQSIILTLLEFR